MKKMCSPIALFLFAACLIACDNGSWQTNGIGDASYEQSANVSESDGSSQLPPTVPDQTTVDQGIPADGVIFKGMETDYRGDLYWCGSVDVPSNAVKTVEGNGYVYRDNTGGLIDGYKYAFQIQYSLIDYDENGERVVTKSFYDFTDSDEDLAFYNAEVDYFESLGIEVLKDHRCANSTPGETNGNVPALAVVMDKEQCANLLPRLKEEYYSVCYAVYYSVAPLDTPDRYEVYYKDEMEWEWDSHPYRSDLLWVETRGFQFNDIHPGEKRVTVAYESAVFSPSDRMALEIGISLFDHEVAEARENPQSIIQKYRGYLESLGIEIWEDVLPDPENLKEIIDYWASEYGEISGGFTFYASVTVSQLENITVLDDTAQAYYIIALNYEQFISVEIPELAG